MKSNCYLCIDMRTRLQNEVLMVAGKNYEGILRRDIPSEDYGFDNYHFTFTEIVPVTSHRNPQVFNGKYITVTRWADGTLHPHLKPIEIGDEFDVDSYASEVANELLWALEGLVEK